MPETYACLAGRCCLSVYEFCLFVQMMENELQYWGICLPINPIDLSKRPA